MYIDTHAHLDFPELRPHLQSVIQNAELASIEKIITIGIDAATNQSAVDIARDNENIFASVGWHPHDASKADNSLEEHITRLVADEKVVAIGEIGLDYFRNHSPHDIQQDVFARMIRIADRLNLPIIVHCRDAYDDTLRLIEENAGDNTRGVFHCFSGDVEQLRRVLEAGFLVSYTGNITYKNTRLLPTVQATPVDKVMLETDCPFMTPHPHRGKRNEPAYIPLIAEKLADVKGLTPEDIGRITNFNVFRLFGIGKAPQREIAYQIRKSLYLAITSRCTNRCIFCPRVDHPYVKGHSIGMSREEEPDFHEIKQAVGDPTQYSEVVFCGFGEPTLRLDMIKQVSGWLKSKGVKKVRLNTNGQGNLIHDRDIVPDLVGLIDTVSISLNEYNAERYQAIARSRFGEDAFPALLNFAKRCVELLPEVIMTVVTQPGVDVDAARRVAEETGAEFRAREYNEVG